MKMSQKSVFASKAGKIYKLNINSFRLPAFPAILLKNHFETALLRTLNQ